MNERMVATMMLVGVLSSAAAKGPDAEVIARVTGLQPEVKNGVAKVSVPRIMFLHFRGKGPPEELARAIETARATQQK